MARIYLDSNETYAISSNATVYGAAGGSETVQILTGATNISVDSSIEKVTLASTLDAYQFKITGNIVEVSLGSSVVASINAGENPILSFADGTAGITMTGLGAAKLGNSSLTSSAASYTSTQVSLTANTSSSGTISVSANGSSDASSGNITYNISAGDYTYNIAGFGAGDVLQFPTSNSTSVSNSVFTDGAVDLTWASSGSLLTIHLTGISAANDAQLYSAASFNSVFGTGTII